MENSISASWDFNVLRWVRARIPVVQNPSELLRIRLYVGCPGTEKNEADTVTYTDTVIISGDIVVWSIRGEFHYGLPTLRVMN